MINICAISGSLRKSSTNRTLLRALCQMAPKEVTIKLYDGLGTLPLFNPDLVEQMPVSVLDFRLALKQADALVIASPEYAHGITGVLKNALDWVVATGDLVQKPIALLNTSSRAHIAYESLREIVTTMDARVVPTASLTIPLPNNTFDEASILSHPELVKSLEKVIFELLNVIGYISVCPAYRLTHYDGK